MPKTFLVVVAVLIWISGLGSAQSVPCPTGIRSDKMVCLIPQVFGPNGLVLPGGGGDPAFVSSFNGNSLTPLNSAIVRESASLPLASPASGITYTLDPLAKVPVESAGSFGPIFGERAETIGKYQFSIGLAYQYFQFNSLDGSRLKSIPEVFTQPDPLHLTNGDTCSISSGLSTGECAPIRDVVTVKNRVDLAIQQVATFMSFGITNRIDLSVAIPIQIVRMSMISDATIVNNSLSPAHRFADGSLTQTFSSASHASGIGDITLRVKGAVWKGEHAALALATDIRFPTGDSLNYLGTGAFGVSPFVIWSYNPKKSRFAPHLNAGFEVNGSSKIIGDLSTGSKERLPSRFIYSGGADAWLTKRLTVAFDLLGQSVFRAQRLKPSTFIEPGACLQDFPNCAGPPFADPNQDKNVVQSVENYNALSISVGAKVKLISHLLLTVNGVFPITDAGLKAKPIPMVQLGYTF